MPLKTTTLGVLLAALARAAVPLSTPLPVPLIQNGGFEETDADGALAGWTLEGAACEEEDGNHFLRLKSRGPEEMTKFFYLKLDIPKGFENLELKFRARYEDVLPGKEKWHDARFIMNFLDKDGATTPAPHIGFSGTSDWREVVEKFPVPPDAAHIEILPSHFYSASGTLDLDDLRLTAVDPSPPPTRPLTEQDTLVVKGNRVFTRAGREVWLQGLNIPSLEWWHEGDHLQESVEAALRDWNVNVIRLAVSERFWFGDHPKQIERNATADAYRALVDETVDCAARQGCYVMLDLHGFGAPSREHAAFWADAAKRYANHPAVLFDLFNEPHGTTWKVWRDGGAFTDGDGVEHTSLGMQKLLDTVRATGAKNIAVAGGLDWAYDLSGVAMGYRLAETGGNGVMYATHIYPDKKGWAEHVLPTAAKHPVYVGEAGCRTFPMEYEAELAAPYQWAPDVFAFIQKHRLHWSAWSFHTGAEPCVISDWDFTPTPHWGAFVRSALRGAKFASERTR
ncbi:MAG: glycoside hydrolase family 5 protein [Kiritimatiellaeota bacterium]|nr:glycoside hydrolase family 5 protein [Kiritimatiellota bacterium]